MSKTNTGNSAGAAVSATKGDSLIRLSHWQLKDALLNWVEYGSGNTDFVLPSL